MDLPLSMYRSVRRSLENSVYEDKGDDFKLNFRKVNPVDRD